MRRFSIALVVPAIAALAIGCSDPSIPTQPSSVPVGGPSFARPLAPPVLDGLISTNEYASGVSTVFTAALPGGGSTTVTVYFTHDQTDLYMAMRFDRGSAFLNDLVAFEFDNDNDGIRENGDDIALTGVPSTPGTVLLGGDFYRFDNGNANASDATATPPGTIDVQSVFGVSGTIGVFEFRKTLNSADDAHDFSIDPTPPQTLGVLMQVSIDDAAGGTVDTYYPSFVTYCNLTIGKKTTALSCPAA